ncbi:RdgB/HAM1 family non-canonical purine NTP pyrophosphatase [candidate division KSB1 bacterium]
MKLNILIATKNEGKVEEFKNILSCHEVNVLSLLDLESSPEIIEDGITFEENALKKSKTIFEFTGQPAIADDSGLEIDVLEGKPGVNSARFAGYSTPYDMKNGKILSMMKDVPGDKRNARFKCVIAYSDNNAANTFEGVCEGKIAYEQKGTYGFGYDPIFIPDGYDKTFGELGEEVKNRISHRANALNKFYKWFASKK